MRADRTPCAKCGVAAVEHFGWWACAGFVPPARGVITTTASRVVEAVLVGVGRLFYRYPTM